MKNLLVYTNPQETFDEEPSHNFNQMVKIQIDNSLDLGWKPEDIILLTNFPYEYNGIVSRVVDGSFYTAFDKNSAKLPVINHFLDNDMFEDELYWYHDFDAFQNYVITEEELELDKFDLGLTTYGYKDDWNCGCYFFRLGSKDIFNMFTSELFRKKLKNRGDEKVLLSLTSQEHIDKERYKILNPTYNFNYKYTYITYKKALKPLKVLHFHPYEIPRGCCNKLYDYNNLYRFMYGGNLTKKPFMSERLIRIFHDHGIR